MANSFKNAGLEPVPTVDTVVYTCPGGTQAVIHTLELTNYDAALPVNATVKFLDSSLAQTRTLGNDLPIPVGSVLVWDKTINMEPGDQIIVAASDALRLSTFLSILEIS